MAIKNYQTKCEVHYVKTFYNEIAGFNTHNFYVRLALICAKTGYNQIASRSVIKSMCQNMLSFDSTFWQEQMW